MLGVPLPPQARAEIARRSRGTPRIANRLLRRVRDYRVVHDALEADLTAVGAALHPYDVDDIGPCPLDRAALDALRRASARRGGGDGKRGVVRVNSDGRQRLK